MKKALLRALTAALLLGLAASLAYTAAYFYTTRRTDARMDALAAEAGKLRAGAADPVEKITPAPEARPSALSVQTDAPPGSARPQACSEAAAQATNAAPLSPAEAAADLLLAYYRALAQENPDMVGWIRIPDTAVDYPVMHTPEQPQYYLHRDFDKSRTAEGLPFLDSRCDAEAPTDNLIVYGHNMRSQRMFGELRQYREAEYREAHPLISFDTLTERRTYRVYAGFLVRLEEDPAAEGMTCYRVQLTSDEGQLRALREYAASRALFLNPEAEPELHSQLLTLSTCNGVGKHERFVLMAVRVDAQA